MPDEVKLWGAVTAPRQFFLAQNTRKISFALFGFLGLGHLVDRPAFASYLHHLPNMRPGRPEIHPLASSSIAIRDVRGHAHIYSAARPIRIPSRWATTSSRCITSAYL